MSVEFEHEVNVSRTNLARRYPKAPGFALTIGSTMCVLALKTEEGDFIANAMLETVAKTPGKWEEAQSVFKKYFKYKFKTKDDLVKFAITI